MKTMLLTRWFRVLSLSLVLGGFLVGGSGCVVVAVGAGAGAVAYVRGELVVTLNHDVEDVGAAANKTLSKLKFVKTKEAKDALYQEYQARTADNKDVVVKAKSKGDKLTELRIRVGTFGDQQRSQTILDEIRSRL